MTAEGVDRAALAAAMDEINAAMRSHAGEIVLESVTGEGVVTVRFDAFCASCLYRPATMTATVRPILMAVPGVTRVDAPGTRISAAAERRLVAMGMGLQVGPPREAS